MSDQLGFADGWVSPKLGRNASLERLAAEVKWYRFEKLLARLRRDGPGRPPYDPLLMLKALLLQQCYALSDADLEEAINDRVSFRKFLRLSLEAASPDHTTLCRFRNQLVEEQLSEKLFAEFERQLEMRGLILKRGTMIDASLVESPLIRRLELPPANVNDTVAADPLVCGDEQAVYADKAYAKRARRQWLRGLGIKPRIMHKSWGGGPPLTHWQRRHNKLIAPIRAQVEGVFATLKRWMGLAQVRYKGLAKNRSHWFLVALAYNMNRALKLA